MNPNMDMPPYFGMPMSLNSSNKYPPSQPNSSKKPYQNQFPRQNMNMNMNMNQMKKPQKAYQDFFKTQLCPMLATGNCYKGEKCTYAHSEQELRKRPDFYKTKLCDSFIKTGTCMNGDKCVFAHGYGDLKSTPEYFKTALCFNWKNTGNCQAGDRCRYAHGDEELKANLNMSNAYEAKAQKYDKNEQMGNSMDTYFPGPSGGYSMPPNMLPQQNPYVENYGMNMNMNMNMNMQNNDPQNFLYMGNNMQAPIQNYKQSPPMGYNPYDQIQGAPYKDFSGFPNRK